ncbi:hypothetical protein DYB32_004919 [Aphanomyces invadans]|uniref:Protein ENHANCED DISEASE RESISTANCE 2 C-terminal domain-containing protein n=1 Tax=Aphanomyces invadans TaxID=157072 RepID=A0A3R6Z660_9STRA|nr:hypothetical protein DYB32_004919 [Aphanomyces invadans]
MFPQRELFVLNILLPGTPEVMYAQYFALRPDGVTDAFSKLWRAFMDGTDEFRNARLKLIPRVVEGPWMIRKAVGSKPFILANALEVQWFRGKNYLEAVVDVSSDSIAKKVTSMCRMCVASLVVDMALVVEGQSEDELPEAILGCVRYDRLDMKFATSFQFLLDDSDDSDVSSNDDKDSDDDAVIVNLKTTPPPAPSKKTKKKQAKKKSVLCVYFMELAWGEHFSVNSGLCRMDFAAGDNKSFYRALFFLMRQVGRRGCVRSAFEIAKLIWSLDPKGDPMHVLLCLDYYALSARQCQFVVDLVNSNTEVVFRTDKSVAVPSLAPVTVAELPGLQYLLGDVVRATDDLAATLSKFPQVLVPLTEKCGITTTSNVICSAVFANAPHLDDNGIVSHLLHIYVTRHASLWKVNEIQAFLLQSATKASASYNRATFVTELPPLVHKYKRAISPGQELDGMDLDVNNMDPAMIAQLQAQLEAEQARNGGNLPADAHPLLLFLQTLLPWNRIQQPGQRPANFDENPVYQPADE